MLPPIRYVTTTDGVRIGYCVHGSGPPLLFVRGWISHLEGMWDSPAFRAFIDTLAERFTVIRYDSRGQGVSERNVDNIDIEALSLDVEALMEVLDLQDVVLYGQTFGGPIAMHYAAHHPYRISKLILDGTYARVLMSPEDRESFITTLERMWPDSISLIAQLTTPDPSHNTRVNRRDWAVQAVTAEMAGRLYRLSATVDSSTLLGDLTMPTLVMHRRRSRSIPLALGRDLAAGINDASFIALEGTSHNSWEENPEDAVDAIGHFLGVDLHLHEPDEPRLVVPPVAVLFTDIEGSTAFTSKLGDARAQSLVRTHDAVVRAAISERGGTEEKHTGDGIMASFQSISAAVECALDIQRGLRRVEAPFRVRIGIDAGEPLREGTAITGTVVQSARRIVDRAQAGQILVSETVRRLVAGRSFPFVDRGRAQLRGLPDRVRLFEVAWEQSGGT